MNTLMKSKSAEFTTEEVVRSLAPPEATDTYTPVAHAVMLDLLDEACQRCNLVVEDRGYVISKRQPKAPEGASEGEKPPVVTGERMFGLWTLSNTDNGHQWAIGLRNSYDRSFSYAITAGVNVMVCANLSFHGKYFGMRKHTSGLSVEELRRVTLTAVSKIIREIEGYSLWHRSLRAIPLTETDAMAIMVEGMERGVFSPSSFKRLLDCWREELALAKATSLYTVFGAFTRLHRDADYFKIAKHTGIATQLIDEEVIQRTVRNN